MIQAALRRALPVGWFADLILYGLVSVVALGCDYALLLLLVAQGFYYLAASAIGFSAGIVIAYGLSARFVFGERRAPSRWREAFGFFAIGIAGLCLTQLLLALLVSGLKLDVGMAKLPTSGCVFLFNFIARRGLVFIGPRAVA